MSQNGIRQMVTARIRDLVHAEFKSQPVPLTIHGVVVDINVNPSTIDVILQGTPNAVTNIRYPDWYTPSIEDVVVLHRVGTDLYMVTKFQD